MRFIEYVRSTILPSRLVQLFIQSGLRWSQDNCPGMAAALSYHALFAMFPLLLVMLSIISSLIGPDTEAFRAIATGLARALPPEAHELVKGTIVTMNENSVGAGLVGFGILLFASSSVFGVLRYSVNYIWRSADPGSSGQGLVDSVLFFIKNRLFAFLMVLGTALLLLVLLVSNIVIRIFLNLVNMLQGNFEVTQFDDISLDRGLQTGVSFLILAIAICILFKILPSVGIQWRDVWLGALLTAVALFALQQLVGNSVISIGGRFLSYGVIGSVMILMLWIFLTVQIFFFGCEFTYVYAHLFGSRRSRSLEI
ncbi:YihY/virulence factor BrkB family protein [Thermoleptolyngbya sichuanensis A183]|uniref:YihY/virulence factor BrkB family protein n=1 Tax=Thermoleptolyngbya sichuanensis A183 TaxID=2737172 RepID=A0A6M8BBD2_9CYAN|nr:YihY/virulence factor BrkB family protein [Thermoleptolyngbya sichuanensis A183]